MKEKKKSNVLLRFLILVACTMLILTGVFGCQKSDVAPEKDKPETDKPVAEIPIDSEFFDVRRVNQIVIPKYNASYLTVLALNELNAEIAKVSNKEEPVIQDNGIAKGIVKDHEAEQSCEILVGQTNRTTIGKITNVNDYIITPLGDKLIIDGGSVRTINYAISLLKNQIKEGNFQVKEEIKGTYTEDVDVADYSNTLTEEYDGNEVSDIWKIWDRNAYPETGTSEDGKMKFLNLRDEKNVWVGDGYLNLTAYMDELTVDDKGVKTQKVRTAKMDTEPGFWFRYGYIEFSSKAISAPGLSNTYWIHGDNTKIGNLYNEFDFCEFYGNSKYYRACPFAWKMTEQDGAKKPINTYYGGGEDLNKINRYQLDNGELFSDAFHTYGLEWDENWYRFIIDGEIRFAWKYTDMKEEDLLVSNKGYMFTVDEVIAAYQQPSYAVLSIKSGSYNWIRPVYYPEGEEIVAAPERIYDAKFDGEDNVLKVDYMTIYQKEGQFSGASAAEVRAMIRRSER